MNFGEEIASVIGKPSDYRFTILGGGGYFEGIKSILSFGSEKIELELKRRIVSIEGENLSIAKYAAGDVGIRGFIKRVTLI